MDDDGTTGGTDLNAERGQKVQILYPNGERWDAVITEAHVEQRGHTVTVRVTVAIEIAMGGHVRSVRTSTDPSGIVSTE